MANMHLPAYVTYRVESHAGFDAIKGDETTVIVVRTSDGKIVRGRPPNVQINADSATGTESKPTGKAGGNVILDRPFKPECYRASAAAQQTFDAQPAEAIQLEAICHDKDDTDRDDTDFTTLYADPSTHRPIAVVGERDQQYVKAHIDERFVVAGGYVMPASFTVKVQGSGPMFWLDVDAHQSYSDYKFSAEQP
jgi:hypothetical protein